MHRALNAAHVEFFAQDLAHAADHDGQVFGFAARHHRVNGDVAHVRRLVRGRHVSDHFVRIAARPFEHPLHARFGGRNDGQSVGPLLLEEKFEFVNSCSHVHLLTCEPQAIRACAASLDHRARRMKEQAALRALRVG